MSRTEDEVFELLRSCVLDVLPAHAPESIRTDRSLTELGADSLERFEIVVAATDLLEVTIDPTELTAAPNLGALAVLLHRKGRAQ